MALEQAERIILLEAVRTAPFGLNLLAVRDPVDDNDDPVSWAADSVVATIKKLYGEGDEFLPRLERYLDLSARTLIPSQLTLLDTPRLFEDTPFRQNCLAQVADSQEQQALRRSWAAYDKLRPGEQITHTEALVNRLERLLAPPIIRGIVGSRETTVPFNQILHGDRMLIVSLPSDRLSPERCDFIGAMLLCALADRIFARNVSGAKPPRLHLYLDEYQRFATSTTAELLEQGRKYSAGVTLAHQTLYQFEDKRIRNAARHAGTLMVLGVTRPDAEELAGEFPVKPQQEWVETIEEFDGTEPKLVPSPTPAEDIYLNGHSDDLVDVIARCFFKPSPLWTTERVYRALGRDADADRDLIQCDRDTRKSAGIPPRPGWRPDEPVHPHVQLTAYDLNGLLVDAMAGELTDPEALVQRLLWCEQWWPTVYVGERAMPLQTPGVSTMYYYMANKSPSWISQPKCKCPPLSAHPSPQELRARLRAGRIQHVPGCNYYELSARQEAHNALVERVYFQEARTFVEELVEPWLRVRLVEDREAFRNRKLSKLPDAFGKADNYLAVMAWLNRFNGLWQWRGQITIDETGEPRAVPEDESVMDEELFGKRAPEYRDMLTHAHQRLFSLDYLCEALYKEPVMISSGEQQQRRRTRHVVHSAQTQADALNEFAAQLVNPRQKYVAHVRMPTGYHETLLQPPLDGGAGKSARIPDPLQPDDIRIRSRALYTTSPAQTTPTPSVSPQRPLITRRSPNAPAPQVQRSDEERDNDNLNQR